MATYKGLFRPENPKKYVGDIKAIVFRSRWEMRLMCVLDRHPDVLEWASEPIAIPYADASTGYESGSRRFRRYHPDFLVKRKSKDGLVETLLIEVKPAKETRAPTKGNKTMKRYTQEALTFIKNRCKWEAAQRVCDKKGWRFMLLTEKELGLAF